MARSKSFVISVSSIGMMCGLPCRYMMIRAAKSAGTISSLPGCWYAMMRMVRNIFTTCWQ
ncbi:MAG: hypothetical protein HFG88_14245 [Dorea sp.]|nr:hypothetical protein [Dorea sp.]